MSLNSKIFREEAFARRGQREPIDGPLRVDAPHEWIVLIGVVLAFMAALAWGVFGRLERSVTADCVLAQPGEAYAQAFGIPDDVDTDHGFVVLALVRPSTASQLEVGMKVRITTLDLALPNPEKILAEVASVPRRSTDVDSLGLSNFTPVASSRAHVVPVQLTTPPQELSFDGDRCHAQIVLSRDAPVSWLGASLRI